MCDMLVGTVNDCWKCERKGLTVVLSLYHCTVGVGLPVALQFSIAKLPTLIMYGDLFNIVTSGPSKEMNKITMTSIDT